VRLCLLVKIDVGLPAARTPLDLHVGNARSLRFDTCCERVWLRRAIMYNARHGTHAIRGFAAGASAAAAWLRAPRGVCRQYSSPTRIDRAALPF
jgi:hypothetical protein